MKLSEKQISSHKGNSDLRVITLMTACSKLIGILRAPRKAANTENQTEEVVFRQRQKQKFDLETNELVLFQTVVPTGK